MPPIATAEIKHEFSKAVLALHSYLVLSQGLHLATTGRLLSGANRNNLEPVNVAAPQTNVCLYAEKHFLMLGQSHVICALQITFYTEASHH